jgi:hypothetical protein
MSIVAIVVILILSITLLVVRRKISAATPGAHGFDRQNKHQKIQGNAPAPRSPYRATSIMHDENACEAVKAIGEKRFLDIERNTPKLPLPNCDIARCNCRYAFHSDRRTLVEDRRHPNALKSNLFDHAGQSSRRSRKRGRRKTDWA